VHLEPSLIGVPAVKLTCFLSAFAFRPFTVSFPWVTRFTSRSTRSPPHDGVRRVRRPNLYHDLTSAYWRDRDSQRDRLALRPRGNDLNILLSFAQFEREVIGERVRDKIAASKKKGMWMSGVTPLGYAIKDRELVIVPEEAETVRLILRRYREPGSVRLLRQDLDEQGIRSKQRTYGNGSRAGGQPFSRGALYALLSNPVYIGEIAHKAPATPGSTRQFSIARHGTACRTSCVPERPSDTDRPLALAAR
jgi:hypothetical protein